MMASASSPSNQPTPQAPARPSAVLQRRGAERVQAILDAAESLLAEHGYEAATLKAIGERAGIPTASVYHYFSDRGQVETALAERYARELSERIAAEVTDRAVSTIRDAIDALIDPQLAYCRENSSFVKLWYAARTSTLSEVAAVWDEAQEEDAWHFLLERKLIRPDTPLFVLQCAWKAGDRLFDLAFQLSPTGDDATIDEARRLVTAYLETYAPQPPKRQTAQRQPAKGQPSKTQPAKAQTRQRQTPKTNAAKRPASKRQAPKSAD